SPSSPRGTVQPSGATTNSRAGASGSRKLPSSPLATTARPSDTSAPATPACPSAAITRPSHAQAPAQGNAARTASAANRFRLTAFIFVIVCFSSRMTWIMTAGPAIQEVRPRDPGHFQWRDAPLAGARRSRQEIMQGTVPTIIRMACLLLAWLLCGGTLAQDAVELQPGTSSIHLSPYVRYHHDPDSSYGPEDAWRQVGRGSFEPLPGGRDAFGFQTGTFWFHVAVVNR